MISILFFLISTLLLLTVPIDLVAIHWEDAGSWLYLLNILTHMFGHAGWSHLLGNYMFLFPYGLYLEEKKGQKRFLSLWFISGLSSLLLQRLMTLEESFGGLIGASGAISGVMAGACLSLNENRWYRAAGFALLSYRLYREVMNATLGFGFIAYWGHVGGILGGIACVSVWALQDYRQRKLSQKSASQDASQD